MSELSQVQKKLLNYDNIAITYDDNGNVIKKVYTRNGKQHRSNGPAVEFSNGDAEFWYEGKLCRIEDESLPAVDTAKLKKWYTGGVPHRKGNPAIIATEKIDWRHPHETGTYIFTPEYEYYEGGYEMWMENGKKHRIGGPTVVSATGKGGSWFLHGEPHRLDGPIVFPACGLGWHFRGVGYKTEAEHGEAINKYKLDVTETLGFTTIEDCFRDFRNFRNSNDTAEISEKTVKTSGKFKLLIDGQIIYADTLQILAE
jgi:hypothetical protein